MTWREQAACLNADPVLFDPLEGAGENYTETARARITAAFTICGTCPVTALCGAEGIRKRLDGVWGGRLLSRGRTLQPIREPRKTAECGTETAWERHRRHKEEPCTKCAFGHQQRLRLRREARRRSDQARRMAGVA